jgi:hypothetical protein
MARVPVYELTRPVPVEWLDEVNRPDVGASLAAGTILDLSPFVLSTDHPSARIRVNGREALVRIARLKEALPGWSPRRDHAEV